MAHKISFTVSDRNLLGAERDIITATVRDLRNVERFFSGASRGDCFAAVIALRAFPKSADHVVIVPRYRDGICAHYAPGVSVLVEIASNLGARLKVIDGPRDGKTEAAGYLRRDDSLAEACTALVAFPPTTKPHRSGYWATVRRAEILGRMRMIVPLDGSKPQIHK